MVEERTSELRGAQDRLLHQERLTVWTNRGRIGHELRSPWARSRTRRTCSICLSNLLIRIIQNAANSQPPSGRVRPDYHRVSGLGAPQPPFRRATDLRDND